MKRSFRKIAVALLAVMVFSALAGYVYAANATFQEFSVTTQAGTYGAAANPRQKQAYSAMALYINSSSVGSVHNVRVMGSGNSALNAVNCTVYNNRPADHVVCGESTYYSLKNTVKEDGYGYAFPSIMHSSYGTVSGKWAPDSGQSYASPSAP